VTTANPAFANSPAVSRANRYEAASSSTRAEPKIETAGRSISSIFSKPAWNSAAISATSVSGVPWPRLRACLV
jgi:hypothetical protein